MSIQKRSATTHAARKAIIRHMAKWRMCANCAIGNYASNHVIFRGTVPCGVMIMGAGPDLNDDETGSPFSGRYGEVLDLLIQQGIADRYSVCITHAVACRPCDAPGAGDRAPTFTEVHNCASRVKELITIANPSGFVLVGTEARALYHHTLAVTLYMPVLCIPHPKVLHAGIIEQLIEFTTDTVPNWQPIPF